MHLSEEAMTEAGYILLRFDEHFSRYRGRNIALYPGEYLEEIIRHFDPAYHFYCILAPDCTEVPDSVDLVILTDRRTGKEPDYNRIRQSCEEKHVPLTDLFGTDQVGVHGELKNQGYLTVPQWKEVLAPYEVVSLFIPFTVADHLESENRWVLKRRFLILYEWMKSQGKTVVFSWEEEEQYEALIAGGIDVSGGLYRRGTDGSVFLQVAERYEGKKIIHVGIGTVRDGIVPRGYGLDSRLVRFFTGETRKAVSGESMLTDIGPVKEAIRQHDVISFDIFDTLLKRTVLYPKDVFEIVEERTGVRGFADSRYKIQTGCPELCLEEIYDRLRSSCGYDDATARFLRGEELKTESALVMPRKSMTELFSYAKELNKTVVLVSDMYLAPEFIGELLTRSGITGYSEMLISCQYGKLKQEGLFEELSALKQDGQKVLHIGDDYCSDYLAATDSGLDALVVPSCLELACGNGYSDAVGMCRTLADRKLLGLAVAIGFDDSFRPQAELRIACMTIAPMIMGYLQWLRDTLSGKGYDWLLLSARDGCILTEAYRKLRQYCSDALPPEKYFYTSRHAAFMTVMDDYATANYFFPMERYSDDPRRLLRRVVELPEEELLPWNGETVETYYRMHEAVIREKAEKCRIEFRAYLEAEGIAGKKCAVMDYVSEGSSQMMMERHLPVNLDGFYFAIPEYISKHAGNIFYYLDRDLMDYDSEMKTEIYFTSQEPAVDYIGEGGRPVFAEEVRDKRTLDRIRRVHDHIRGYLGRYLDHLYSPRDVFDRDLVFTLCRTVRQYQTEEWYYDDLSSEEIPTVSQTE